MSNHSVVKAIDIVASLPYNMPQATYGVVHYVNNNNNNKSINYLIDVTHNITPAHNITVPVASFAFMLFLPLFPWGVYTSKSGRCLCTSTR